MAWNIIYKSDTQTDGVGTVTAINGNFDYSRRVDTNNQNDINDFVSTAISKYNSSLAEKNNEDSIAASILALFNQ